MHELFRDIAGLQGVRGVVLLSLTGETLYERFHTAGDKPMLSRNWRQLLDALANVNDSELVFANGRLYVRKTAAGYILVVSSQFAQGAMIRLHCDILLPELAKMKSKKKKRFFKR